MTKTLTNTLEASFFKLALILGCISVILPVTISLINFNSSSQLASAAPSYVCNAGETLVASDCVIPVNTSPTFATQCPTGFVESFSICVQKTANACSTFNKAEVDPTDSTLCRFISTLTGSGTAAGQNPLISEIGDKDGRYCRNGGFNVKIYKVAIGNGVAPEFQVCGNTYSSVGGASTFRFEPFRITAIGNYQTVSTGTTNSACPSNYTVFNVTQCKRPALTNSCTAAGEYFANDSTCKPCPAGQYCPLPNTNSTGTAIACVNGGTLSTDSTKCTANNKITTTTYTDGCPSPLIKMDQTCVIPEVRLVDTGCSYFYASEDENIKAIDATNPATRTQDGVTYQMCSTGGVTSFDSTSIEPVAPFECLGTGSSWYNYNIRLDPLICGIGNPADKVNFRWTAATFSKITPLQKIPADSSICPNGWTMFDATTCFQAPVTVTYKAPLDCAINTYSQAGAASCTVCPVAGTSTTTNNISSAICGSQPVVPTTTNPTTNLSLPTPVKQIVSKVACVSEMGYYTNLDGNCLPCPQGMTSPKGSTSLSQCYNPTVNEIVVPTKVTTVRTGGLDTKQILFYAVMLITSLSVSAIVIKKRPTFQSEWIKLK